MKLKLVDKRIETKDVKTFIFQPQEKFSWIAGQYLIHTLPHESQDLRGKMRFFTISASPFEKNPSITTRIVKNSSSFKKALDKLKIGDFIESKGPDGDFIIEDAEKKYVFLAGGIGITPFHSIIRQLDFEKKPVNVTLLYSNRNSDILFKNQLDEISEKHNEFKINYLPKRIEKKDLKAFLKPGSFYFVSGPDPMVAEMEEFLLEFGVTKENVKSDYFSGYKAV